MVGRRAHGAAGAADRGEFEEFMIGGSDSYCDCGVV